VFTGRNLSRKNGRGTSFGATAICILGGNFMKNKKILFGILAAVVLVALAAAMFGIWYVNRPAPDPVEPPQTDAQGQVVYAKTITIEVVHSDNATKTFTYQTNEGFLGPVLYAEGLIKAEGVDEGMFNIVDGEKADWNENKSYWSLYVGEEYAMTGVDTTPINDGDTFKLVYTIG
jgi:hypothetical protein